jgi:LDH2 family malate/lactate/ureidoglycolate dehydrogenase/glyoxylase-like metal-dependent hydrolase (beta-lactamase superfamily II)
VSGYSGQASELRLHVTALLAALGARAADAEQVASALVDADLCGHGSHGVRQLPYYADQVQRGEIDPAACPRTVLDRSVLSVLDGRRGFGHVIAADAAGLVAERAREHGIAAVAVRNANHIGRLGGYTEIVAGRGQAAILLVSAQGADQQVAPFGGIDRRLSNNPLSIAAPGPVHPIVLDMALSEAAESRVLHAAELGVQVPDGWVLDAGGRPSRDPSDYLAGGSLLPVGAAAGSHKGYSLIVLLELVVGLLAGVAFCGPATPPFSNAFVLIAIELEPAARARAPELAQLIAWIKSARRHDGGEILVPGELEHRCRHAADGMVALDAVTVAALDRLAQELGVRTRLGNPATIATGSPAVVDPPRPQSVRGAEPPRPRSGRPRADTPVDRATAQRLLAFHCGGDRSPLGIYDPLDPDGARLVYGPYLLFVVEHADGLVLFDTGMHPRWRGREGRIEVDEDDDVLAVLARGGIAAEHIDHVVVSHLHYDHAGGLRSFRSVPVWVQADELRFARSPAVYQRELYDAEDFEHELNWQQLDGGHDLFGDGAVTIVPTPGHTPGHQALCVELAGGLHVLAADASYLDAAMRIRHLPGVVWNPDSMVASWEQLEALERDRDATLIFTHEPEFRERTRLAPEAWYG